MAAHHIQEIQQRVSDELAAGNSGALLTGHYQRMNELDAAADQMANYTQTRRNPWMMWVVFVPP